MGRGGEGGGGAGEGGRGGREGVKAAAEQKSSAQKHTILANLAKKLDVYAIQLCSHFLPNRLGQAPVANPQPELLTLGTHELAHNLWFKSLGRTPEQFEQCSLQKD